MDRRFDPMAGSYPRRSLVCPRPGRSRSARAPPSRWQDAVSWHQRHARTPWPRRRCGCLAFCSCRRAGCRCSPRSQPSARRATSRSTSRALNASARETTAPKRCCGRCMPRVLPEHVPFGLRRQRAALQTSNANPAASPRQADPLGRHHETAARCLWPRAEPGRRRQPIEAAGSPRSASASPSARRSNAERACSTSVMCSVVQRYIALSGR